MKPVTQTLNATTVIRYLGPAMVHPVEYWSKMWRLQEGNGKYIVVKCPSEDNCVLYYTDSEGIEHRDALTSVQQLPPEYRQEKVGEDIAKTINSNTELTFKNVASIFGEPFVDPDIPFVYKWTRGDYELTMIGKIFSYVKKGQDDRSTASLFGHLPVDFRHALNTQNNKESSKQVPVQMPDPKSVLKETDASKAAKQFESMDLPETAYQPDANHIKTLEESLTTTKGTVADEGFDLDSTLKNMGISVTKMEDDEFPDDDDSFVSSATLAAEKVSLNDVPSSRKEMVLEENKIEYKLEDYEGVRDGKCPEEIVAMRRKVRAAKAAETRKKNKAKKAAKKEK